MSAMDVDHDVVVDEEGDVDMGYEECVPQVRRGSMTLAQERERRASIKAVMADKTLSPKAKRLSIQHLMDGRRSSISSGIDAASVHTTATASSVGSNSTQLQLLSTTPHNNTTTGVVVPLCMPCTDGAAIQNEQTRLAEQSRPPCTHYERWCTMIAPCCGGAFGCRICHDECPELPQEINSRPRRYQRSASLPSSFTSHETNADNHHPIDRFAVSEIICRHCYTRQSSKANNCINCGIQFGAYHCNICNLWMSDEEQPYHCPDCGFCRVGGRENFQHCNECGMCIDRTLYDSHNCKAGKYRSNCPVCQEYLFSSRGASHEMPCGHAIHWECFRQLAVHDSRCPVCKKTAETRERMMPTWSAMAAGIDMQPVPPELARVVNISCIDCEKADYERAWHFLGTQCKHCQSFNTVVDRILLQGDPAHRFLMARITAANSQANGEAMSPQPRRRLGRRRSAF